MKRKVYCPHCGKWLLSAETDATGIIYAWCKYCKKEIEVNIKSLLAIESYDSVAHFFLGFFKMSNQKLWSFSDDIKR